MFFSLCAIEFDFSLKITMYGFCNMMMMLIMMMTRKALVVKMMEMKMYSMSKLARAAPGHGLNSVQRIFLVMHIVISSINSLIITITSPPSSSFLSSSQPLSLDLSHFLLIHEGHDLMGSKWIILLIMMIMMISSSS